MKRKKNQTKMKDNKIIVVQPYPGTLVVKNEQGHPPEFYTVPLQDPIPSGVTILLRPDQKDIPIQITEGRGQCIYSTVPVGQPVPKGNNIKIIEAKLAPGT